MKKLFLLISVLLLESCFAVSIANSASSFTAYNYGEAKNNQISFTENKGQVHDQNFNPRPDVLYGVMAGNMAVHIKRTGVSYQLYRVDSYKSVEDAKTRETRKEIDQQSIYRIDLTWLNANPNFTRIEDEALPGYNNYYLESCPDGAVNVKSYQGLRFKNLYRGIDLHYYEKNGELKHDYIVAPNADYKQIQIQVLGADISINDDGTVLLSTPFGKIQEGAPTVYQNGKKLTAHWKVENKILSFEINNYDPKYELIIDPVTRLWGTYYGGTDSDFANASAADSSGNIYMGGVTRSGTGSTIATSGAHQSNYAGSTDAYIVKFDANGLRQWGTYYGDAGSEGITGIVTSTTGHFYVSGGTTSNSGTVIATIGSHQSGYGGGQSDCFLIKFDYDGIRQWATHYGGTGEDMALECALDLSGNCYLAGYTSTGTSTSIATIGSHQATYGSGQYDAFLAKFDSNGIRQWGTYYGGSGEDKILSCSTDKSGNIIIVGETDSPSDIATSTSHQNSYGGGVFDAFVVKFSSSGIRQWGSYYGGYLVDRGNGCKTDTQGNIYVMGTTNSNTSTAIATAGSHQSTIGGFGDAFLTKFTSAGLRQWGTYYGGNGADYGTSCTVDQHDNIYISGYTNTNSGIVIATTGSHQSTLAGSMDAFLALFNGNGNRISGTYFGGGSEDVSYDCATDPFGNVFLTGRTTTSSGTNIATQGSHQSNYGGGTNGDAFLVKFAACNPPSKPSAVAGGTNLCKYTSPYTFSVVNDPAATSYTWSLPAGWSGSGSTNILAATPGSSGIFTLVTGNICGASPQQTLSVTVHPLPTLSVSTTNSILCEGESATLTALGAMNYTFNPGGTGTSITISPNATTEYSITGVDANGCENSAVFTQSVVVCNSIRSLASQTDYLQIFPNPASDVLWIKTSVAGQIEIVNLLGQVVYSGAVAAGEHKINVEHLNNGIYILKSKSANVLRSIEFIIDK